LTAVGLYQLVAATPAEYVERAAGLAADLGALGELRASLRDRMLRSPLCNGPAFTRGLEQAYRQMWRQFCSK
jgi:predicted O-linked N-acetylglucosamine transferase (SPINDLY family)